MKNLKTDISVIEPEVLGAEEKVKAWFSLKNGGLSTDRQKIPGLNLGFNTAESKKKVVKNRQLLFAALDLDPKWVAFADQVHSNRVRSVSQGGTYPETDGLVTVIPGLTLAIQVADCAAVLLWDDANGVIGALHAGWRGAAGDIVPRGIEEMVKQGADTAKIKAFVSPCIALRNFEVGPEVAVQFPADFVDEENYRKPHVDLKGFLENQLLEAGLNPSHIEIRPECTIDDENFYSYRREGETSGRMMALIQLGEA